MIETKNKMEKIFYIERCKCCWHFNLLGVGFGKKDGLFYLLIFNKTKWLNK